MVEELFPAFIPVMAQMNMQDRIAFGLDRLLNELHVGLLRRSPAFFGVTLSTRTDNIVPGIAAAECSRYDMVQRQFAGGELLAAILTSVAVTGKNIPAIEFDGLSRQPVVKQQSNDPRHGNIEINPGNPIVFMCFKGLPIRR